MLKARTGLFGCLVVFTGFATVACGTSERSSEKAETASRPSELARDVVVQMRSLLTVEEPASTARSAHLMPGPKGPRSLLAPSTVERFDRQSGWLVPVTPSGDRKASVHPAELRLPAKANGAFQLRDADSGMQVEVALEGATESPAETSDGYVVYRDGYGKGRHVLHRASATGTEDYVVFQDKPEWEELQYTVHLGEKVAGLRLVENVLEFLDEKGTPVLRAARASIVDSGKHRKGAHLAIDGCAYDSNAAAPWGRMPVEPKSRTCTVKLSWQGREVQYPAVVDPAWELASDMAGSRTSATGVLLSNGKVLVSGGMHDWGPTLTTVEVFDPVPKTWATTGSMAQGRREHCAVVLPNGSVLVAGGMTTRTIEAPYITINNTSELWSGSTWTQTASKPVYADESAVCIYHPSLQRVIKMSSSSASNLRVERYDPATQQWISVTQPTQKDQAAPAVVLLQNGSILVAGGYASGFQRRTMIYNPVADTWDTSSQSIPATVSAAVSTAGLLPNGDVVMPVNDGSGLRAAIFHPATKTWKLSTNTAAKTHSEVNITVLGTGKVLFAGGKDGSGIIDAADVYDPTTDAWMAAEPLIKGPHAAHVQVLLSDGRVLLASGGKVTGGAPLGTTDTMIFHPQALSTQCGAQYPGSCDSGFCSDSVCCDKACAGPCESCNLLGSVGTCTSVSAGTPDALCPAQAVATCGTTGLCGAGAQCAKFDTGTQCKAPTCVISNITVSACDGLGACTEELGDCGNYVCKTTTSCRTNTDGCSSSVPGEHCAVGSNCVNGKCIGKIQIGGDCVGNVDCVSQNCWNSKVCCNEACNDPCKECSTGSCKAVTDGTSCPGATCGGSTITTKSCKTGQCTADSAKDCPERMACDGPVACRTGSCGSPTDCASSAYCNPDTGKCIGKVAKGKACSPTSECALPFVCVDGFCCDTNCVGGCERCNAAGHEGTCYPVNAPVAEHGGCKDLSDGCGGSCKGKSECDYPLPGTSCGKSSCTQGIEHKGSCSGANKCEDQTRECKEFACGTDTCLTQCTKTGKSECGADYYCDVSTHACLGGLELGAACETAQACTSKVCDAVAKTCCDKTCDGDCSTGTCKPKGTTTNNTVDSGGGCGCHVSRERSSKPALLLASLLGLALVRRRWN